MNARMVLVWSALVGLTLNPLLAQRRGPVGHPGGGFHPAAAFHQCNAAQHFVHAQHLAALHRQQLQRAAQHQAQLMRQAARHHMHFPHQGQQRQLIRQVPHQPQVRPQPQPVPEKRVLVQRDRVQPIVPQRQAALLKLASMDRPRQQVRQNLVGAAFRANHPLRFLEPPRSALNRFRLNELDRLARLHRGHPLHTPLHSFLADPDRRVVSPAATQVTNVKGAVGPFTNVTAAASPYQLNYDYDKLGQPMQLTINTWDNRSLVMALPFIQAVPSGGALEITGDVAELLNPPAALFEESAPTDE